MIASCRGPDQTRNRPFELGDLENGDVGGGDGNRSSLEKQEVAGGLLGGTSSTLGEVMVAEEAAAADIFLKKKDTRGPLSIISCNNNGSPRQILNKSHAQVDFRFHDICFSVEVSKMRAALMSEKAGVKEILRGVSGAVESGQILAIIGASGAGKTSLLDVLVGKIKAGTKGLSVTGDVIVNGEAMSRAFFLENAAYVPQEDRLWSALTVRENLMFACKMYGPDMSRAQCEQRVAEVVASLGLESCQDTKVGNIFLKGISGGQKRRTSIGVELVVRPKIVFLDEPTSGLDAAAASEMMALLRRLASETDMIIITSVHQPSTRVFNSFDQVILLTMGQTAYFGPAVGSLEHFAKFGHVPVGLVNPADYLLEITNSDFSDAKAVQHLADEWLNSPACATLNQRLGSRYPTPVPPGLKPGCRSRVQQLGSLITRVTLNSIRDPVTYAFRLVLYMTFSFFLGSVYFELENTQADIADRTYLILWINAFNAYMTIAALPVFALEMEAVVKEVQNGQYGAASYCIANTVVQLPFVFLIALSGVTPVYFITGMNDDVIRYLRFTLAIFLLLLVVETMAQIIGVLIKNFILGIAVFACLVSTFFIFNGFFIAPDNMPPLWVWIYWISPLRHSWGMTAKIVFEGQTYSGFDDCEVCYGETGKQVLHALSLGGGTDLNEVSLGGFCGIMLAQFVAWRLIHYIILKRAMF
ncbi:unnamed protein product [Pylaiella littoralis]